MSSKAKVHQGHYTDVDLDTVCMVGICSTTEGQRIRVVVGPYYFLLTPAGAEWMADILNRTADKVRLPLAEHY